MSGGEDDADERFVCGIGEANVLRIVVVGVDEDVVVAVGLDADM